jgi:hypothetical protein
MRSIRGVRVWAFSLSWEAKIRDIILSRHSGTEALTKNHREVCQLLDA